MFCVLLDKGSKRFLRIHPEFHRRLDLPIAQKSLLLQARLIRLIRGHLGLHGDIIVLEGSFILAHLRIPFCRQPKLPARLPGLPGG